MKVAFIFPGQGAQYVGMGQDFYQQSPQAKTIFDQADNILKNNLRRVIFEGPAEQLTSTAYCQPAIFTMSIAALKALEAHPIFEKIEPCFAAGLSLGECTALAAAEALSFEDTLRLVSRRSALMEEACKMSKGKMYAIIGLERPQVTEICQQTGAEVANFNSPQQIVITGHADKSDEAAKKLAEAGAKSVIPLDVSGAFHSSLMKPAADKFVQELEKFNFQNSKFPIVSNVDGKPASDPEAIRCNLARQITSSVQWVISIENMVNGGIQNFIEIGPGKVLKGLIRRINKDVNVHNIEKFEDIARLQL
ncbi:MAG: ACP S-malonyltransferase, partial [Candidatus Omnitrophica bacterium]|nr:ACP S-malonyltransferase [Candidatus Omnitrophota bacterium]